MSFAAPDEMEKDELRQLSLLPKSFSLALILERALSCNRVSREGVTLDCSPNRNAFTSISVKFNFQLRPPFINCCLAKCFENRLKRLLL